MQPTPAVLAVVAQSGRVLLVRRAHAPDPGRWGFPGGHIEPGEAFAAAALRELREETALSARAGAVLDVLDVIRPADPARGTCGFHFVLVAVLCTHPCGSAAAGDDALELGWFDLDAIAAMPDNTRSDGVPDLARKALARTEPEPMPSYDTSYDYETFDVFTDTRFGGNPLAVLPNAAGLTDAQMQTIAIEFNYSETTFVLPPVEPGNSAHVRIFTPGGELPFAGHPNIGTAIALARHGRDSAGRLRFEEAAGLVVVDVLRNPRGEPVAARLEAPQALSIGAGFEPGAIAACLGLTPADIVTATHAPLFAGLGTGFVIVQLTPEALGRAESDIAAQRRFVAEHPLGDTRLSLCLYATGGAVTDAVEAVQVRVLAPLLGIDEDPATGSAAVALVALLLARRGGERLEIAISQGSAIGRPSRLEAEAWRAEDGIRAAVAGGAVAVMRGRITV